MLSRCRPPRPPTTTQIAIRLPRRCRVGRRPGARASYPTRSEAIRRVLEDHLTRLAGERDARIYQERPLTDEGPGSADAPDAWAGTPPW